MVVITKIEFLECDEEQIRISINNGHGYYNPATEEFIPIKRYVNRKRNVDIVIGTSKEVGDLLGIQLEYVEQLENDNYFLRSENNKTKDTLNKAYDSIKKMETDKLNIESYGFFKRLKCLFCGIK